MPANFAPRCRGESMRLKPFHGRLQVYENSFLPATIRLWNNLPRDIINHESLDKFKSKISAINLTAI